MGCTTIALAFLLIARMLEFGGCQLEISGGGGGGGGGLFCSIL